MAGRIPKPFIDELLTRVDIVEVIDHRLPLKKGGSNYLACCPFHSEKTPSFTVSPSKQFYHCFGCGAHGTAIGFLMEFERLSFPEAVETLAESLGLEVPREGGGPAQAKIDELQPYYQLLGEVDHYYRQQLKTSKTAADYLKNRGLSGVTARDFGLGYAPPGWDNVLERFGRDDPQRQRLIKTGLLIDKDAGKRYDRFRNRIMFPIHNRRGKVIGFGGRSIDPEDQPKYLNSPETPVFHKGRELYGLYQVQRLRPRPERIVVVEGYMDVVVLAEHGVRNAVATLGTATSAEHIRALFRAAGEIVFCFDGDRAGRDAAWRALETALPALDDRHQIRFLFLPEGDDPDSYIRERGREAFEAAVDAARPLSAYLFDTLNNRFDTTTLDGRAQLAEQAKRLIAQTADSLFRQLLINQLSDLTGLSAQQLGVSAGTDRRPPRQPRRGPRENRLEMSDVRSAIAALLTDVSLARNAGPMDELARLDNPGVALLRELVGQLHQEPNLTTAMLLERYRETPHWNALSKLAAHDIPNPDGDETLIRQIFTDALSRLTQKAGKQRYLELLDRLKNRPDSLTETERAELRAFGRQP